MRIAFDIDDTLWKIVPDNCPNTNGAQMVCLCGKHFRQVPDYDLIQVLRWFVQNGDEVFVWSGGGVDYAGMVITKLGLHGMVTIIPKTELGDTSNPNKIDIAFDDNSGESLARVNVIVKREHNHKQI